MLFNSTRVEVLVTDKPLKQVIIHGLVALDCVGSYAHAISQTLAVHCVPDETYIGATTNAPLDYQPVRMLTPQEVANRACDIAEALYRKMERRGLTHDIPAADILLNDDRSVGFASK